ncbi:MAG: GAF domain-containing protein [Burkholderiales bacterium]|nr:GAF domain-containing protein [Burkholderiales bacterium]
MMFNTRHREASPGNDVRSDGASLLAEIAVGVSASGDLRELLARFLDPIVRLAGAQAGAVRVLAPEAGAAGGPTRLQLVGQIGLPPATVGVAESVDRHCGYCGEALAAQSVVWASDLQACKRRCPQVFGEAHLGSMLVLPLRHRGRVLGVYNLFYGDDHARRPEVAELLEPVGELLGLALNNARLEAENLRATVLAERQAMAAEVHDSMAQMLTFVKMRLPLLQDAMLAHDDTRSTRYLSDVRQAVGEAHASLREIVTHWRTRIDPRGLLPALETLAGRFRERSGVALAFDDRVPELALGTEGDAELFHIVQEALANIERHAGATHAWLQVERLPGAVEVCIEDDGIGPSAPSDGSAHHGLEIMRLRAERLGATLAVEPRPGGGTRVELLLPEPAAGARA